MSTSSERNSGSSWSRLKSGGFLSRPLGGTIIGGTPLGVSRVLCDLRVFPVLVCLSVPSWTVWPFGLKTNWVTNRREKQNTQIQKFGIWFRWIINAQWRRPGSDRDKLLNLRWCFHRKRLHSILNIVNSLSLSYTHSSSHLLPRISVIPQLGWAGPRLVERVGNWISLQEWVTPTRSAQT